MTNENNIPKMTTELIELVIEYVKSQTLVPLKRLGKYLGFGIAGSVFMSLGLLLLNLGLLRLLQTLEPFEDTFSFVPYLILVIVNIAITGILFSVISRKTLIGEK